jgi:CHASE1-domain containing sensor protein
VRPGQPGVDLTDVIEVVDGPCRKQLAQRHLAERRMQATPIEIRVGDGLVERRQVGGAQVCEPLHQVTDTDDTPPSAWIGRAYRWTVPAKKLDPELIRAVAET